MRNRYLIEGYSIHYQDIQVLDYRPPFFGDCHLDIKFLTGNGDLRRLSKRLHGTEAFALRLWLGKKEPDFRRLFDEIERTAKARLDTVSQLTLPVETNSGIPL